MKSPRALDKMKPLSTLGKEAKAATSFKHQENHSAAAKASKAVDPEAAEIPETEPQSAPRKTQTDAPKSGLMGHIWRVVAFIMAFGALGYVLWNLSNVWAGQVPLFAEGNAAYSLLLLILLGHGLFALGLRFAQTLGSWPQAIAASSNALTNLNTFLVAGVFWALVLVGVADFGLTLLRLLDVSDAWFGEALTKNLFKKDFRFPYVHLPLLLLGFVIATYARGLGFIWLSLLIVFAELTSAIVANIFSFTNVFVDDLVRLWYAGLFLMAAAYTLLEGGHVRVDVLYAGLGKRAKHRVNLWGSLILGLPFAWVILLVGTANPKAGVINGPLSSLDIGQNAGAGLFIQYLMPWLLLMLGLILVIQFCALILDSAAHLLEKEEAAG